jgi:hypothetical protein
VSIFDEKVDVSGDRLTQKIAFVSQKDFVIPAITLKYFNPKTKEIKTIQTKEFKIDVVEVDAKLDKPLNIKRQDNLSQGTQVETNYTKELPLVWALVVFTLGVVVGVVIMLFKSSVKKDKKKSFDIKDEKMLLVKLLAYEEDPEVKEMMRKLEANIYADKKEHIDKKELKNLLKRLGIA